MTETVDRLVWVVAQLREHCPWTRRLTHPVLTEYLIEEAYEAVEVIESVPDDHWGPAAVEDGSYERMRLEMGDVLFQVVLHAAIATDHGGFDLDDAAEAITAKMIRRNPHVFHPDGTLRPAEELAQASIEQIERNWERIKSEERAEARTAERAAESTAERASAQQTALFAALPPQLPALAAAGKVIDRAARQPVDPLPVPGAPLPGQTPDQEPDQPGPTSGQSEPPTAYADEAALGAELFRMAQRARAAGLDPERALRRHLGALYPPGPDARGAG